MEVLSITEQRAAIGLTTPTPAERAFLWANVSVPQAGLSPSMGGYQPHRILRRMHNGPWRYVAIGGGLRGGKSLGAALEALPWLPHADLIWLAGETYDLARQEFEYLGEAATSLGLVGDLSLPKNKYQPCALETEWGTRVETRSLHDLGGMLPGSSLVARAPDLIIICEPGFAPAESLQQARERLTTRRGRLWMAGTFENANTWFVETWHAWKRWPNIHMGKSAAVPSWLNTYSFPGGRNDPEILSMQASYASIREFLVRWGGVPMASEVLVMGAYWDEKKHVAADVEFKPLDNDGHRLPVYLAIDPGFSGKSVYAVLAIQQFGANFVVFDEVICQTLVHEEVIDVCRTRPWWSHVAGGIIDPYAGESHVYGSFSPLEIWWRHGRVPISAAPRFAVEDVVSRLQFMLRDPANGRTHVVVSPHCKRLRYEMGHWRRMLSREGFGAPSTINCDATKALAYFASAKYTETTLGAGALRGITVHDYTIGGRGPGVQSADRYRDYPRGE